LDTQVTLAARCLQAQRLRLLQPQQATPPQPPLLLPHPQVSQAVAA